MLPAAILLSPKLKKQKQNKFAILSAFCNKNLLKKGFLFFKQNVLNSLLRKPRYSTSNISPTHTSLLGILRLAFN